MVHATCEQCRCDFGYRTRGGRAGNQGLCQVCKPKRVKVLGWRITLKVNHSCHHCGIDFVARNGQQWCSNKCRNEKRNKEDKSLGGRNMACVQCGQSSRNGMICSEECQVARWSRKCKDCSAEYMQKKNTSGKCQRCRKRDRERASSVRLRVRQGKVRVAVNKLSVREVWERDGGVCQLCQKKINWESAWPDSKSMSVDHIVPLSKGGTDEGVNVQAAHLGCNSRKRNKAGSQKRLFG